MLFYVCWAIYSYAWERRKNKILRAHVPLCVLVNLAHLTPTPWRKYTPFLQYIFTLAPSWAQTSLTFKFILHPQKNFLNVHTYYPFFSHILLNLKLMFTQLGFQSFKQNTILCHYLLNYPGLQISLVYYLKIIALLDKK